MATKKIVWCLAIYPDKTTHGSALEVECETNDNIAKLKEKVKDKKPEFNHVAADRFNVWQCMGQKLLSTAKKKQMEEFLKNIELDDETKAIELSSGEDVKGLNLVEKEILLVQVPNDRGHKRKREGGGGAETDNPSKRFEHEPLPDEAASAVPASCSNDTNSSIASQLRFHVNRKTCLREATVRGIWERIRENRFVWVLGPPGSGKTTLAELLAQSVKKNWPSVNVIFISMWEEADRKNWSRSFKRRGVYNDTKEDTLLIFDEGQATYSDSKLWNEFLKAYPPGKNIYVVMFASYGRVPSAGQGVSSMTVPLHKRIGLCPVACTDHLPPVGLLFTKEEFTQTIQLRYSQRYFDQTFLDGLLDMTGGHIGAINDCLELIEGSDWFRKRKRNSDLGLFTWKMFHEENTVPQFMEKLANKSSIFARGLPKPAHVQDKAVYEALSSVIQSQSVEPDKANEAGYLNCSRNGWLHSEDIGCFEKPKVVYCFASPLHQRYVEWMLFCEIASKGLGPR